VGRKLLLGDRGAWEPRGYEVGTRKRLPVE
jgi:hypothetical protein